MKDGDVRPWALLCAGLLVLLFPSMGFAQRNPPLQPDPWLTPGEVLPVGARQICTPGYSRRVRDVSESLKRDVYASYRIRTRRPGEFEVDHLISLELGGSNSIRNLWPQSYETSPYNAHLKDALENRLHALVCRGALDLRTAQQEIATDWISAYRKYVGEETLARAPRETGGSSRGSAAARLPRSSSPRRSEKAWEPPPMREEDERDEPRDWRAMRRRPVKRCGLKNLWCGFGVWRR